MDKVSLSTMSGASAQQLHDPKALSKRLDQTSKDSLEVASVQPLKAPKRRWRLLAHVASAIARFRAQLNPTYTYGHKKQESADTAPHVNPAVLRALTARKAMSAQPFGAKQPMTSSAPVVAPSTGRLGTSISVALLSGRSGSGRPQGARHMQHGNKTNILLGRLPEMQATACA